MTILSKFLSSIFIFFLCNNVFANIPTEKDIIDSALKFYPKIIAEQNNLEATKGNFLSQKGNFDAKIKGKRLNYKNGYYDNKYYNNISAVKPLPFANSEIFTSYSKSSDQGYPLDNDSNNTLDNGRVKIGFSMSLLRGFLTNENLAKLKTANIDVNIANENLKLTKLSIINNARKSYYSYIIAKRIYDINLEIFNLRKKRLQQVIAQSKSGDKPKIYITDSKRSLLSSKSSMIDAEQNLQSNIFNLSLYYRDQSGDKIIINADKEDEFSYIEKNISLPKEQEIYKKIEKIKQERFDIKIINLEIKKEKELAKLYKNQFLPELDFNFSASKDFGDDLQNNELTELKQKERLNFGVNLEIPLQRNKQKGLLSKTKSKIRSLKMKKKLTSDSIEIDIKSIYNQIVNLHQIYNNLKEEIKLSQKLLEAEKERFKNGGSDIITINIREQNLFETKQKMLKYLQKMLYLQADYDLLVMNSNYLG